MRGARCARCGRDLAGTEHICRLVIEAIYGDEALVTVPLCPDCASLLAEKVRHALEGGKS